MRARPCLWIVVLLFGCVNLERPRVNLDARADVGALPDAGPVDAQENDTPDPADKPTACGAQGRACCATGSPCATGLMCAAGVCVTRCGNAGDPCCTGSTCSAGLACESGSCRDRNCPQGQMTCGGACVDPRSTREHCGGCERACPTTGANVTGGECQDGACRLACSAGFADCDGAAGNGCEVNTQSDATRCGACSTSCTATAGGRQNVTPACVAGACRFDCAAGFGNCDNDATNGCETALTAASGDPNNCGVCGNRCPVPPVGARSVCRAGSCDFEIMCRAGVGDCDGVPDNGCETTTATDIRHCGACGAACGTANGTPSCVMGVCQFACSAGFANCDGDPTNGCETNTATNVNHCGACRNVCPGATGRTPTCIAGACGLGSVCAAPTADCDGVVGNGCEVNASTDARNCGGCGRACNATNGAPACAGGACVSITCSAGYGDCDMSLTNGCEASLTASAAHCGRCGNACSFANASASCVSGACRMGACNANFGDCDTSATNGCETDLRSAVSHCGACGRACVLPNTTTAGCLGGSCRVVTCAAGFGNCDIVAANGCETALTTSASHCGACDRPCTTPANGTTACLGGACVVTCNAGYALVAGSCVAVAAPRPVAPLSTHGVTSQRPTFRWQLATGTDGARVQICRDRACAMTVQTVDVTGSSGAPTTALSAGRYFWRLYSRAGMVTGAAASPVWEFTVGRRSATVGTSWGEVADFNRDGYADLVVASPNGGGSSGRVYVYPGSATGIDTRSPESVSDGYTDFGSALAHADFNGDGFTDLVVANSSGPSSRGQVYVYSGSASGLDTSSPTHVSDGDSDFGTALTVADFNGDGYADLVVANPSGPGSRGQVYVYSGSALGLNTSSPTNVSDGYAGFGSALAHADFNGDGYADLVVANPSGPGSRGQVYVYSGSASGINTSSPENLSDGYAGFGTALTVADFNGDGYANLVVANLSGPGSRGQVYVYSGSASGINTSSPTNVSDGYAGFGSALAHADFNGDGYADLVVANLSGPGSRGQVYVYSGSASGINTSSPANLSDGYTGFGMRLTTADFNGDGYADLVVANPTGTSSGRVYVYPGNSTGISTSASTNFSDGGLADFGSALMTGDFNGDGFAELAVANSSGGSAGRVYVYPGSSTGIDTRSPESFSDGRAGFGSLLARSRLDGSPHRRLGLRTVQWARREVFAMRRERLP